MKSTSGFSYTLMRSSDLSGKAAPRPKSVAQSSVGGDGGGEAGDEDGDGGDED